MSEFIKNTTSSEVILEYTEIGKITEQTKDKDLPHIQCNLLPDAFRINPEFFTPYPDLRFSGTCHDLRNKYQLIPTYHCSRPGCYKMFFDQKYLKTHEATHELEKSFICPYDNCVGVRFSTFGELKTHFYALHFVESQKQLQVCFIMECPWIIPEKCNWVCDGNRLWTHLDYHRRKIPYLCPECGSGFKSEDQFKLHQVSDTTLPCTIACICCLYRNNPFITPVTSD